MADNIWLKIDGENSEEEWSVEAMMIAYDQKDQRYINKTDDTWIKPHGKDYEELRHYFNRCFGGSGLTAIFRLYTPANDSEKPEIWCMSHPSHYEDPDMVGGKINDIDTAKQLVAETIHFWNNSDFDSGSLYQYFDNELRQLREIEEDISPLCGDYEDGIWLGEKLQKASFDEITDPNLEYYDKDKLYYVQRTGDACDIDMVMGAEEAGAYVGQYHLNGKDEKYLQMETYNTPSAFMYVPCFPPKSDHVISLTGLFSPSTAVKVIDPPGTA